MVTTPVIPSKDTKDPDYGKSLEHLKADYLWEKTNQELSAALAKAARLQLYRR